MDSLGDYIYLIVILIAGLSGILKKRKKKAEQEKEIFSELPDLDDVIPEFQTYENPPRPFFETAEVKPEQKSQPVIQSYETIDDFRKLRATKQVDPVRSHLAPIMPPVSDDSQDLPEISLGAPEDAKKAFIYAEIFNRKY